MATITIPAKIHCLGPGLDQVTRFAIEEGFGRERVEKTRLAVEEALVNICRYAFPDRIGQVEIRCIKGEDSWIYIEIIDDGEEFNVLSLPVPELDGDATQRQVGGLGILLIRSMADTVDYQRDGRRNVLRLGLKPRHK